MRGIHCKIIRALPGRHGRAFIYEERIGGIEDSGVDATLGQRSWRCGQDFHGGFPSKPRDLESVNPQPFCMLILY
jgi:hypothetical protein